MQDMSEYRKALYDAMSDKDKAEYDKMIATGFTYSNITLLFLEGSVPKERRDLIKSKIQKGD